MFRFFRQLRLRFLAQNRFTSYLFYALGEIVLVVIGILLALQINNWNEARKERLQEIKIYREILSDLEATLSEVNRDLDSHRQILGTTQFLINQLITQKPYADSVITALLNTSVDLQVYPKSGGFETLSSIGLDLLSNDTVRMRITDLYQLRLKRVVELGWRETPSQDLRNLVWPYIEQHFEVDPDTAHMRAFDYGPGSIRTFAPKLRDYSAFLQDSELLRALNYSALRRAVKIQSHYITVQDLNTAIVSIANELERIE